MKKVLYITLELVVYDKNITEVVADLGEKLPNYIVVGMNVGTEHLKAKK
jgi:hypothetical protein